MASSDDVQGDDAGKMKMRTREKLSPTLLTREGVAMPRMLYGTAWKAERTADLVATALRAGFRGIDTACQPKHYQEKGVGDAIAAVAEAKDVSPPVTREGLFLQTKYTPIRGMVLLVVLPGDIFLIGERARPPARALKRTAP